MIDLFPERDDLARAWTLPRLSFVAIPASTAIHAAVIGLLILLVALRPPLRVAPPRSIEVEIIAEPEFDDAFEVPPDQAVTPLAVPRLTREPDAAPPAPPDGMTHATELFANRVLADPQNKEVRETLPQLEATERITQLCNIEGLEQLLRAKPVPLPDSISPSAFAPTKVRGYTLEAGEAAYRAARKWYRLRFTCTVTPDLSGVSAYAFEMGEEIPESEREAHDLIAADDAE